MKTIHLIRHAKSSWSHPELSDIERPLNKRGRHACRIMARPILDAGCSFENVFCSVARRTQLTIEGLSESIPKQKIAWQLKEALYTFDWEEILSWVHQLDDSMSNIVIIGHNPALTDFCNEMGDKYIYNIPTCGYAQLTFSINRWRDLSPSCGKLETFLTPKTVD